MKKNYFLPIIMAFLFFIVNKSFGQFVGMIEIKETTYQQNMSENKMNDMIPPEARKEIMKQIEERENELKNKSKSDEDYQELADEIKMMKEQLGVSSKSNDNPEVQFTKLYFLDDNVRTETISGNFKKESAIIKAKEKKIIVIMDEEKQYMELDFNTIKQMTDAISKMNPNAKNEEEKREKPKSNIKKTGKSQVILGYKCDEYILEEENTNSTVYICQNFSNFWKIFTDIAKSFEMNNKKDVNDWYFSLLGEGGFPFKEIEKNKNGDLVFEMEITKIDKSKPSALLFTPPKDYKKVSLEDMFKAK